MIKKNFCIKDCFFSHQIQQYFNQLPVEKVPKLSSKGEHYRNKMLMLQLPKQDLALSYCKYVDKENVASYEDFVAARNEIALDIGMYENLLVDNFISYLNFFYRIC